MVDSVICNQANTYISAVLLSLSAMLQLELPHINVLSKIDLLEQHGNLGNLQNNPLNFVVDMNLEFYTEVQDLQYLEQYLNRGSSPKYQKLNHILCELIQDFNLVAFHTLNIEVRS